MGGATINHFNNQPLGIMSSASNFFNEPKPIRWAIEQVKVFHLLDADKQIKFEECARHFSTEGSAMNAAWDEYVVGHSDFNAGAVALLDFMETSRRVRTQRARRAQSRYKKNGQ